MKKTFIKYLLVLVALGTGTIIFLFAQNGYLFPKPASEIGNQNMEQDQVEDIGTPTNDDPWNEMDKLVAAYYNKQGVSFKGLIKLIDDNGENEKVIEEQNFEYSVLGKNLYYRLGNMEFVSKPDIVLVADHTNKFISVSIVTPMNDITKNIFDITEFKKLMEGRKAEAKVTQLGN